MKLSILISTKNRKEILRETLDVIFNKQYLSQSEFEVIVTNDGEEDINDLKDVFKYNNFRIFKNNHKQGLSGGRNNSADMAQNELLIFFDDDILVTSDYFIRLIDTHQRFSEAISCGNRFYPAHIVEKAKSYPFGRYKLKHEYDWTKGFEMQEIGNGLYSSTGLAGFSLAMHRSIYLKNGPFDENFEYAGCEDSEFLHRAKKNGYKLIFDKENICFHNEMDNFALKAWLGRQSRGIRSAVVMCMLHPEGKDHPTWYTNTPDSKNDSREIRKLKRKKKLLSKTASTNLLFFLVWISEKLYFPDKLVFRFYNALWLGQTYKSFNEALVKFPESE